MKKNATTRTQRRSAEQELAALKRDRPQLLPDDVLYKLADALILSSKKNGAFFDDVADTSVTVSDDSDIGIVRRALSIAKQLKG